MIFSVSRIKTCKIQGLLSFKPASFHKHGIYKITKLV